MAISQDAILEKLKKVIDPELFVNIVDLGLIYEIKVGASAASNDGGADCDDTAKVDSSNQPESPIDPSPTDQTEVQIDMTMTSPACPAGPQLIAGAKREVGAIDGVGEVEVRIVLDPPWTPDRMTEDAKDQLGIF